MQPVSRNPGQFISEPLTPLSGFDTSAMARGEPGLPAEFSWRSTVYKVARVLRQWKTSSPEGGVKGAELYLRRHWYEIETQCGRRMTLYCDRQTKNRRKPKARWWLYSIMPPATS